MSSRSRSKPQGVSRRRTWRVSIIRKGGQLLGFVDAPTRERAEATAARTLNLSDEQREPLVAQERI